MDSDTKIRVAVGVLLALPWVIAAVPFLLGLVLGAGLFLAFKGLIWFLFRE
ncbi:MAG: hypothetical protein RBS80_04235 [Thermoguttaceae bacterium]|jgi:prepilin signal peptidase PulO-like enzyme (type II secretory pathway)|nr:hypothetical protein [Thermoguttaceae bacterium]